MAPDRDERPAPDLLEIIAALDPSSVNRARAVAAAMRMIEQGARRREVSLRIRERYGYTQSGAWRIVDMAWDLSGPVDDDGRGARAERRSRRGER